MSFHSVANVNAIERGAAGIPCEVHTIIQQHCVTCHDAPVSGVGRLDMSKWIELDDGTFNFVHRDSDEKQKSREYTFSRILDLITSNDPDESMPLGDTLSKDKLEKLKQWFEK